MNCITFLGGNRQLEQFQCIASYIGIDTRFQNQVILREIQACKAEEILLWPAGDSGQFFLQVYDLLIFSDEMV